MQQEFTPSGRPISWMAYIFCLALASADLLGVSRRGGFSSLSSPAMACTVGRCHNWCFRRCSPFLDFSRDFYSFKPIAGNVVALHLKISALQISLFFPAVWDDMKENLIEFFGGHLFGGAQSKKKREVVVEFCETGSKAFVKYFARFTHCMAHRALLLGKCVNNKKHPSKPSWMNFKCALFVPVFWISSLSNSRSAYPCNRVRRQFIFSSADVVPVPSIAVLKLFMSVRNYSGWPFSNVTILSLYIYESALGGL